VVQILNPGFLGVAIWWRSLNSLSATSPAGALLAWVWRAALRNPIAGGKMGKLHGTVARLESGSTSSWLPSS